MDKSTTIVKKYSLQGERDASYKLSFLITLTNEFTPIYIMEYT